MPKNTDKFLIFSISQERYGINIKKVREVIRYESITHIRDSVDYLKGVINLRGKIIPVIDMRIKFSMEPKEYNDRTVFIIVEVSGETDSFLIGLAVDKVEDVIDIDNEHLEKTPEVGFKLKSDYLYGIARVNDKMVMILNIDNIIRTEDIINIKEEKTNTESL
jgi:purine-binding chemotaxis protein CheW